jgi:hypothetical protein
MKIKPYINPYYLTVIDEMISRLDNSKPGKRRWTHDEVTGLPNYSTTERSTFPDWSKFFYVKTPKDKYIDYCIVDGPNPYDDDYFNGNTKELKRLLNNSKDGVLSKYPRIIKAWEIAIHGFLDDIRDFEDQYNESYYSDEVYNDFPF